MCHYVPARIRSYPFKLVDNSESGEKVFCKEESHITDSPDATAFFDSEDNLTAEIATAFNFRKQCESSRIQTQVARNALEEAGVIDP